MALNIKFQRAAPVQEEQQPKEESIFDALQQFHTGKMETLMLVNRECGACYRVLKYDPKTRRVTLANSQNQQLTPMLTEREERLYKPMWR